MKNRKHQVLLTAQKIVVENSHKISARIEEIKPINDDLYTPKIEGSDEEVRLLSYNMTKQIYGEIIPEIVEARMEKELKSIIGHVHENLPFLKGEVLWAVRHEMARTVEDVLARRVRALFLDARASIDMANDVAVIIAKELGYDKQWVNDQVITYTTLANSYLLVKN